MSVTETIRIIRTWHVQVAAEYGDTPESLVEKGITALADLEQADPVVPDGDEAILMPEGAEL